MNTYKRIIYGVILIAIALGIFFGLNKLIGNKIDYATVPLSEILKLNEPERTAALEAQVASLQKKSDKFSDSTSASDKFSVYIKLAEAQFELEKWQDALNSLNSIPEEKKDNSRAQSAYVIAMIGIGSQEQAKALSSKNLDRYDEDTSVWVAHLQAYSDLPNDELNSLYRQAIAKTKSALPVMISYAGFSERTGDIATAVAAWETAANVDPSNEGKYREEIARLRQ